MVGKMPFYDTEFEFGVVNLASLLERSGSLGVDCFRIADVIGFIRWFGCFGVLAGARYEDRLMNLLLLLRRWLGNFGSDRSTPFGWLWLSRSLWSSSAFV